MRTQTQTIQISQPILWAINECPACQSSELLTDYRTGEVFCTKCGLVIF